MQAFFIGLAVTAVLAVAVGFTYDWVAVDSAEGFRPSPYVHVTTHHG